MLDRERNGGEANAFEPAQEATVASVLVMFIVATGGVAYAANPTTAYDGCMKVYKPYSVTNSGGYQVAQAKSVNTCTWAPSGVFQNCLERSSWNGDVSVRCNAWKNVGEGTVTVSGCVQGTYDYHTKQTMKWNHDIFQKKNLSSAYITSEAVRFGCAINS